MLHATLVSCYALATFSTVCDAESSGELSEQTSMDPSKSPADNPSRGLVMPLSSAKRSPSDHKSSSETRSLSAYLVYADR